MQGKIQMAAVPQTRPHLVINFLKRPLGWACVQAHNKTYLAGKEMPADFHKDLVVLVWSLVPRHDDLSTRTVLKLVYLREEQKKNYFNASMATWSL